MGITSTAPPATAKSYHQQVFRTGGSWTPPAGVTNVDLLLVAGGSGGYSTPTWGGGGGSGVRLRNVPVAGAQTVVIGAGGAGGTGGNQGSPGGVTSFGAYAAPGGAAGGSSVPNQTIAGTGASPAGIHGLSYGTDYPSLGFGVGGSTLVTGGSGGAGGASFGGTAGGFMAGGVLSVSGTGNGTSAAANTGGGGGGAVSGNTGGNGGTGFAVVGWWA